MRSEKMLCNLIADEYENNVLVITPFHLENFKQDSIYEFILPDIHFKDGSVFKSQKIKYITSPSLAYCTIDDIKTKLGDIDISDAQILYHIREASRLVEYYVRNAYEKQNINFSKEDLMQLRGSIEEMRNEHWLIWNIVVLKATYECLLTLYITMATKPDSVKEILSDLSKEFSYDLQALKELLNDYKKEFEEELKELYTMADPTWALRGKWSLPYLPGTNSPYHGLNGMSGYNRSYNTSSYSGGLGWGWKGGRY